jgi:Tol biopolymer transport system component
VIAYERQRADRRSHGIWAVETATERKRQLATGDAYDPAWSPSGRLIAYRRRGHAEGIYIARANGSHVRRITDQEDKNPAFSPSGTRVAFDRHREGYGQASFTIFSVRLDGSHARRIAFGRDPVYSPDGRSIAYLRGGTGRSPGPTSIGLVRPAGSGDHAITTGPPDSAISDLDWAPKGDQIAFELQFQGLSTMNPDGSNQQVLGSYAAPISYSPNGRVIAFPGSFSPSGGTGLDTVPVGGGTPSAIAYINAGIGGLAWQPLP